MTTNQIRRALESIIAASAFATLIAACAFPTSRHIQPVKIVRYITTPDVCDVIITDGQPQHVCTEVTHVR